jgi:hypothetical protein
MRDCNLISRGEAALSRRSPRDSCCDVFGREPAAAGLLWYPRQAILMALHAGPDVLNGCYGGNPDTRTPAEKRRAHMAPSRAAAISTTLSDKRRRPPAIQVQAMATRRRQPDVSWSFRFQLEINVSEAAAA